MIRSPSHTSPTLCAITYKCDACISFNSCYKCHSSGHIHPDHPFKKVGSGYEPAIGEALAGEDEDKDDDDTDDDTDDSMKLSK